MGCGASKLDVPNGLLATTCTAHLRPLLHRRIEDIRRRRAAHSLNKATPSKKLLLHIGPDEDVEEITCHYNPLFSDMQKHTCSPEVRERCITSKDSYNKNPSSVKEESLKGKANQEGITKINVSEKGTSEISSVREEKFEQTKDQNAEDKNVGDDDDDDGRRIGHDNDADFPGSPSFRIYYTENDKGVSPGSPSFSICSTENANDDKNARDNEHQHDTHKGVQDTAQSEAVLSSKDSMMTVKKGRKRRSLRQAIKGKHGGFKSLQKVR